MEYAQKLTKLFELKKPTIRILDLFLITLFTLVIVNAAKDITFYEFSMFNLLTITTTNLIVLIFLTLAGQLSMHHFLGRLVKVKMMDELGKVSGTEFKINFVVAIIVFTLIDALWFFTLENKVEMIFLFTENIALSFYLSAVNVYLRRKAASH